MKNKTAKKSNSVNYKNVAAAIKATGNKIFSVTFKKRTTGEIREMVCRRKVTKYLKGGVQPYSPADLKLITVWDINSKGYRNISVDNLISMTIEGKKYTFNNK